MEGRLRQKDAPEQGSGLVKQSPAPIWSTHIHTSCSSTPCATPPWLSRSRAEPHRRAQKQIGVAEANWGGGMGSFRHGQGLMNVACGSFQFFFLQFSRDDAAESGCRRFFSCGEEG
jgi:hypothetical protein